MAVPSFVYPHTVDALVTAAYELMLADHLAGQQPAEPAPAAAAAEP